MFNLFSIFQECFQECDSPFLSIPSTLSIDTKYRLSMDRKPSMVESLNDMNYMFYFTDPYIPTYIPIYIPTYLHTDIGRHYKHE